MYIHFSTTTLEVPESPFSLRLMAVGYESRARMVCDARWGSRPASGFGIGFGSREQIGFEANRLRATEVGLKFVRISDEDFSGWIRDVMSEALANADSVELDVSSFSRERLGAILECVWNWQLQSPDRTLRLWYAPGRYRDNLRRAATVGVGAADLLPGFEGAWIDPDLVSHTIVGLGFEIGRVLGALELLEAGRIAAFLPHGVSADFDEACRLLNAPVLESTRASVFRYDVTEPAGLLSAILRLTRHVDHRGRALLLPFGPKLFAATCILSSLDSEKAIPIWRITGGDAEPASEVTAEGSVIGLELRSLSGEDRDTSKGRAIDGPLIEEPLRSVADR